MGSRAHRLSTCGGTLAYLTHGLWDLSRPGVKLVSPALSGGFLTTREVQLLKKNKNSLTLGIGNWMSNT